MQANKFHNPNAIHRIGLVTAGGDAPGMNTVIRSVVRTALFYNLEVVGIERGYQGLIEGQMRDLNDRSVSGIINQGGTILHTIRSEKIRTQEGIEQAAKSLKEKNIDALIAIGGDGTLRGACEIHKSSGIPIAGIPATIDNDVSGTDTTVGFDTAVNTAVTAIDKIRDTATSHERVFIVEVMGRYRGFLSLEVGFAAGAEIILIPEVKFEFQDILKRLRIDKQSGKASEIIVMAEGAGDSAQITKLICEEREFDAKLTVLGHMQRGGPPTARSRVLANNFGSYAVQCLLMGKVNIMVGTQNDKLTSVDLKSCTREPKKLDLSKYMLSNLLSTHTLP